MAKKTVKMKAKAKKGKVSVKALLSHVMETGLRKNKKTGKLIPAHYIQEVNVTANGKNVLQAYWSGSISKNPYLSFSYAGAKGDELELTWVDNTGKKDSGKTKVR